MTCTTFGNEVSTSDSRCFTCPEGTFGASNGCADCGGARRCVSNVTHLLCRDNSLLRASQCTPPAHQEPLLITNNHAVKCGETHFADGTACGECPPSCASCATASSCTICATGTSLSPSGVCAVLENATTQTHRGVVACAEASIVRNTACASCPDAFGVGCVQCSAARCLSCSHDHVLDDGVCRKGNFCEATNGTVCTLCVSGAVPFNATDCTNTGDCAAYVDGACVTCRDELVLFPNGTCAESDDCTAHNGGGCLRCRAKMFPDTGGVCQCLPH